MSWKAKEGKHSETEREFVNMDQGRNVRVTVEMDSQIFAANAQLRESGDVHRAKLDAALELLAE
jgi:hypothetical protein